MNSHEPAARVADTHHKGLVGRGPVGRGSVNTARIIAEEIRALPETAPILTCGKYTLRQGPDAMLICTDPTDEIEFVITDRQIEGFIYAAGLMMLPR